MRALLNSVFTFFKIRNWSHIATHLVNVNRKMFNVAKIAWAIAYCVVLVVATVFNGIWMKFGRNVLQLRIDWWSWIFDLTSHFEDGGHEPTTSFHAEVLLPGEWKRSVCPAPMWQRSAFRQFLICSTFVLVCDFKDVLSCRHERLICFLLGRPKSYPEVPKRSWFSVVCRKFIGLLMRLHSSHWHRSVGTNWRRGGIARRYGERGSV